jgi:hypothetical protein
MTLLRLSEVFFYIVLAFHVCHWGIFMKRPSEILVEFLHKYKAVKYISWMHGVGVFAALYWLQKQSAMSAANYFALAALVFVLWDCGMVHSKSPKFLFLLNLHHIGVFIALLYQTGEPPARAWRNTSLYGWLWSIHSFGILNEVLLPLIGIRLKEGEKCISLEVVRHIYAVFSSYFLYQYLNDVGQFGLGWNYQTLAVVCMYMGRFLTNDNYANVPFLRRVEVPGAVVIIVDHLFFRDVCLQRAASVTFSFAVCLFTYHLMFKRCRAKPEQWFSPDENEHINTFLEGAGKHLVPAKVEHGDEEKKKKKDPKDLLIESWFDGNAGWTENWPLHRAVAVGDAEEVEKLLANKSEKANCHPNAKMTPIDSRPYGSVPIGWAVHLDRRTIIMLLLKHGANPYLAGHDGKDAVDVAVHVNDSDKKELKQFFEKLDTVALKASPPKLDWDKLPLQERTTVLLGKL